MSVYYDGSKNLLMHNLKQLSSEISIEDAPKSKDPSAATEIVKMFKVFTFLFAYTKYCISGRANFAYALACESDNP